MLASVFVESCSIPRGQGFPKPLMNACTTVWSVRLPSPPLGCAWHLTVAAMPGALSWILDADVCGFRNFRCFFCLPSATSFARRVFSTLSVSGIAIATAPSGSHASAHSALEQHSKAATFGLLCGYIGPIVVLYPAQKSISPTTTHRHSTKMNFRHFCLTALASLLATTQAELLINSPAPNSLVEHEGTIQVVVPFASTQAMKQSQEILLVVGLVPCCQDPSSNLGETIFTGTYTPQGFIDGNPLMTYQNFTLIVPPNLGGGVGIQVMRVALGDSPPLLVPDVDFASVQVNAFA